MDCFSANILLIRRRKTGQNRAISGDIRKQADRPQTLYLCGFYGILRDAMIPPENGSNLLLRKGPGIRIPPGAPKPMNTMFFGFFTVLDLSRAFYINFIFVYQPWLIQFLKIGRWLIKMLILANTRISANKLCFVKQCCQSFFECVRRIF